jgi:hypothetical protein
MTQKFSNGKVVVSENTIQIPTGYFNLSSKTILRDNVVDFSFRYDNLFMRYCWRFIVGFLQLFTIVGIPEAIKVLRGDINVVLKVKEGYDTKTYTFYILYSEKDTFKTSFH